jgi:hypothetical protein
MEEWKLVHRVRWYSWIPLSLYGSMVEVFMAIIGLAAVGGGVGFLLGIIPKGYIPELKDMSPLEFYGGILVELMFAAFIAWNGLRGMRAEILAMIFPALTYQGQLEQMAVEVRQTKNSGYRVWALTAGDKKWDIPYLDVSDRYQFKRELTVGKQIRLKYRRGTGFVTHLWVRPTMS